MQPMGCEIDQDVEDVVGSARSLVDCKHYLKTCACGRRSWRARGFHSAPCLPRSGRVEYNVGGVVVVKSKAAPPPS